MIINKYNDNFFKVLNYIMWKWFMNETKYTS